MSRRRGAGPGGGSRQLTTKVKTAKGRKLSSTLWLQRQLNDPYVAEARRLGYRSRAAFKLVQLDDRFHFLKPGGRIVDLGCAPGGWAQVAADRVKAPARGRVVGVDLLEAAPLAGVEMLLGDMREAETAERLRDLLGGPADVVLSDMAASATGHASTDAIRVAALCEDAHLFATEVLAKGGAFVAKTLKGGSERALLDALKREFTQVRHAKPDASRAESAEQYVVATGWRGAPAQDE